MIKVCSLFSGSAGNSIFISCNSTKILVDAGTSGKKIENALKSIDEYPEEIDGILVSHEHRDHIQGVGILSRRYNIPVYANEKTWQAMKKSIGEISPKNIKIFETWKAFRINEFKILPFKTPHDAAESVGFNFFFKDKKVTTATDIGCISKNLLGYLEGSDMILLESNHDVEMLKVSKYPWSLKKRIMSKKGHLCNEIAAKVVTYLAQRGTSQFLLGHLSKENNFPQLAYQTVYNELMGKQIEPGKDVLLDVAEREKTGKVLEVI